MFFPSSQLKWDFIKFAALKKKYSEYKFINVLFLQTLGL